MISRSWLEQEERALGLMKAGPERDTLSAFLAGKREQLQLEQKQLAAALAAGFKRNEFTGSCKATGAQVEPFQGFVRKAGARWVTYSWDAVMEELLAKAIRAS